MPSSPRRDLTPAWGEGMGKAGEQVAHRLFIVFLLLTLFAHGAAVILSAVGAKDLLLAVPPAYSFHAVSCVVLMKCRAAALLWSALQ